MLQLPFYLISFPSYLPLLEDLEPAWPRKVLVGRTRPACGRPYPQ